MAGVRSKAGGRQPEARRKPGRPAGRKAGDGVIADRDTLLEAAERAIRKHGPSASLDAIAAEAGVTKPILYRGVGGREALTQALSRRLTARMTERSARLTAGAVEPEDALRRMVRAYLAQADRDRNLYLYVTAAVAGENPVNQSLAMADTTASAFAGAIAAYRTQQGADASVATVWSYGLVGALHYVTLWWLRQKPMGITEASRQIAAMLWTGLSLEGARAPARKPRARR